MTDRANKSDVDSMRIQYVKSRELAGIFKEIGKQVRSGSKQITVAKSETLDCKALYYCLMWGHTEDGREAGLLSHEKPIQEENDDFMVFTLKADLSSTDKLYLREWRKRYEYESAWSKQVLKEMANRCGADRRMPVDE